MPWQARLDTPRTLHHVMGRGIEGKKYSGKMGIGRIFRFWVLFVEFSFSFIIRGSCKSFFCGSTSSPRTEKLNNFNLSPFTLSLSKGKLRTFARSSSDSEIASGSDLANYSIFKYICPKRRYCYALNPHLGEQNRKTKLISRYEALAKSRSSVAACWANLNI